MGRPLIRLFLLVICCTTLGCSDTGNRLVGSLGDIWTLVSNWDFSTPAEYSYDPNFIEFTNGKASLKQVDSVYDTADEFNAGTHVGTAFSGGKLVLDPNVANQNSFDATWTPHFSNLVAYWKMENNWLDQSGNGLNGTAHGNAAFTAAAKLGTHAGAFDGNGDYVSVADVPALNISSQITFGGWVKSNILGTLYPQSAHILNKSNSQIGTYALMINSGNDKFFCQLRIDGNEAVAQQVSANVKVDTLWHHVLCAYDGATLKIYVDGILQFDVLSVTGNLDVDTPAGFNLGARSSTNDRYFNGVLDEIAIWNKGLSASDVATIYNRQKQKFSGIYSSPIIDLGSESTPWLTLNVKSDLPFLKELTRSTESESTDDYPAVLPNLTDGLIGYWPMNETAAGAAPGGLDIADKSSKNHHGSATGAITFGETGVVDLSTQFDGNSGYVNLGNAASIKPSLPVTISAWVNASVTATNPVFTNDGVAGTAYGVRTIVTSAGFVMIGYADGTGTNSANRRSKIGNTPLQTGKWYHITAVIEGPANMTIYVNGKEDGGTYAGSGGALAYSTHPAVVGTDAAVSTFFNGNIDELAFWSRPLSAAEVLQLYRRSANRIRYQVRSCVDENCQCKSLNTTPAGSATDCDGDGVPNASDISDSRRADWLGSDGTSGSYFSELYNNDDISLAGIAQGYAQPNSLNLNFADFPAAARPINNRYFQYRVVMESDDENLLCGGQNCSPSINSISIGPIQRYFGQSPTVIASSSTSFQKLLTADSVESDSCVTYQFSNDDGSTWRWWNGSEWIATTSGVTESNAASDYTSANLDSFPAGSFKFKAFLNTSPITSVACDLDAFGISYRN